MHKSFSLFPGLTVIVEASPRHCTAKGPGLGGCALDAPGKFTLIMKDDHENDCLPGTKVKQYSLYYCFTILFHQYDVFFMDEKDENPVAGFEMTFGEEEGCEIPVSYQYGVAGASYYC